MEKIRAIMYRATAVVAIVSAICYIAIALLSVADVTVDKVKNDPISGAMELTEIMMLTGVFCSFAYAQSKKAHINMPIVIERLPRIPRLICLLATSGLSIYIALYVVFASFTKAQSSIIDGKMTGILYIKMYPFYFIESIAMLIFTLVIILDTIFVIGALWIDKYNRQVVIDFGMDNVKEYRNEIEQ